MTINNSITVFKSIHQAKTKTIIMDNKDYKFLSILLLIFTMAMVTIISLCAAHLYQHKNHIFNSLAENNRVEVTPNTYTLNFIVFYPAVTLTKRQFLAKEVIIFICKSRWLSFTVCKHLQGCIYQYYSVSKPPLRANFDNFEGGGF